MHVVLLAHSRFSLAEPFAGGLESMTWHLARGLAQRGVQVSVLAPPGSAPVAGVEFMEFPRLKLSRAAREDVSMPEPERIETHHAYLQTMLDLARRSDVDVVHSHSLHHLPIALAPLLRAQFMTTLHTPPLPWLESAISASAQLKRPTVKPRFIAVSAHTARQWSHRTRASVIPNGVDTTLWRPGPGGEALVWSGRMVPEKAPHHAVRIARAAGIPLRLAGPISDRDYFRERIEPSLGGGIEYVGHLRTAELADLVGRSAAALVTPDWDEPFGLVAAEALACGTPVLAWRRGGLPEVVPPKSPMLVTPRDFAAAATALPHVLDYPRQACRDHATAHLSLTTMVHRHLEIYGDWHIRRSA